MKQEMHFPPGFLWGAATAAHQVEGGNRNNDWWEWEHQPGRIIDGSRSGNAAGWWAGRAEDDLQLAARLGHNAHRLSLEWSRLEPQPGVYDAAAFDRYRQILRKLQELEMTSMVTMYHFTLPRWVTRRGGWTHGALPELFARYAGEVVRRLGDLVDWWATINEPMILVYASYAGTAWPPGAGSLVAAGQAIANLLRGHDLAYVAGKDANPDARIGLVMNMPRFDPDRSNLLDRFAGGAQDFVVNELVLRTLNLAGPAWARGAARQRRNGVGASDWYGLNYYGRYRVRFDLGQAGELFGRRVQEHGVRSENQDWGEIYPEGLTKGLLRLAAYGKPLFVTENGIFDNHDTRRPSYLLQHLRATHDAIEQGADVRGYFHWSLVDNFEWAEGWSTRFGLIEMDPVTLERRPRPSAYLYERIIRQNGITPELWRELSSAEKG